MGTAVLGIGYAMWLALEAHLIARDRRDRHAAPHDRGTRRLAFTGCVLGAAAATILGAWVPIVSLPGGGARRLAGGLVVLAGVALRVWAVQTLGRSFRLSVTIDADQRVIDTGPYRRLRHPSYTGLLLVSVGLGVGFGDAVGLAAALGLSLAGLLVRIRVEEAALERELGPAYRDYASGRARLVPGVW